MFIVNSLRGAPPSPMYPTRRIDAQRPKMFRFLNAYSSEYCRLVLGSLSKIGTFSEGGWRCGGGFQRGRIFVAPLGRLLLVLFLAKQEKYITHFLITEMYTFSHPLINKTAPVVTGAAVDFTEP